MEEKEIISKIREDYRKSKLWRANCPLKMGGVNIDWEATWQECYKIYRFIVDKKDYADYKSKVFVAIAFHLIETALPTILQTVFSRKPFFRLSDGELAEELTQLITNQLDDERTNSYLVLSDWIRNALIYGTGVLKYFPYFIKTNGKSKLLPYFEVVDLLDFYPEAGAKSFYDTSCSYCIHKTEKSIQELEKIKFYNQDKIRELKEEFKDNQKIELLEYWTDEYVYTLAEEKYLIRAEENKLKSKPFVIINDVTLSNEFYGIGLLEPIIPLQREINTRHNQRVDNINLVLNQMFKVSRLAGVDMQRLKTQPGLIIPMDDINGLQPLIVPDVTARSHIEERMIKEDIQLITGVFPYFAGQPLAKEETATGIISLQRVASERFVLKIHRFLRTGFKNLIKALLNLNKQFMLPTVINEKIITKENIGNVDDYEIELLVVGDEIVNKQQKRANFLQVFSTLLATPATSAVVLNILNVKEFIKRLLNLFEVENIDELFNIPLEQQELQQDLLIKRERGRPKKKPIIPTSIEGEVRKEARLLRPEEGQY